MKASHDLRHEAKRAAELASTYRMAGERDLAMTAQVLASSLSAAAKAADRLQAAQIAARGKVA